ncbi:Uncharacterised protein [Rhodococcus wratislaviensis]|uniref:Uncharacterized protein n=1 Tax=Rhodococcus wratislaviensis TaxID=44752 RepID=A0AB38F5W6_RHOWR|nr:Uncharacterised protein [Rhodococcus wratislaviensis]
MRCCCIGGSRRWIGVIEEWNEPRPGVLSHRRTIAGYFRTPTAADSGKHSLAAASVTCRGSRRQQVPRRLVPMSEAALGAIDIQNFQAIDGDYGVA